MKIKQIRMVINYNKRRFQKIIGENLVIDYGFNGELQQWDMRDFFIDKAGNIKHKRIPLIMDIFISKSSNPHNCRMKKEKQMVTCKHCKFKRSHDIKDNIIHDEVVYQQGKPYGIFFCTEKQWNTADCNPACEMYKKKVIEFSKYE